MSKNDLYLQLKKHGYTAINFVDLPNYSQQALLSILENILRRKQILIGQLKIYHAGFDNIEQTVGKSVTDLGDILLDAVYNQIKDSEKMITRANQLLDVIFRNNPHLDRFEFTGVHNAN